MADLVVSRRSLVKGTAAVAALAIDEALLRRMWPRGDSKIPGLVEAIASTSRDVFARHGITAPLQAAHIMAQLSVECGAGCEVVENMSYSARRMMVVWPSRFPTLASAMPYQNSPQKLAEKVYGGRMGNRTGTGDAYKFRGRGGSQTTGLKAYGDLGAYSGHDLIGNPDIINEPDLFLDFAVADFRMCGCLPYCSPRPGLPLGDIRAVTHHLNGGYTNEAEREAWFKRWCDAFGVSAVKALPSNKPPTIEGEFSVVKPVGLLAADDTADYSEGPQTYDADGVLRFGQADNPEFEVKAAQQKLVSLNYQVGRQDGQFSSGMRAAVLAFQADNGLATSGEIDADTKKALEDAPEKPIAEVRTQATAADLRAQGSETIQHADKVSWLGKGLAFVGAGKAADASGALDGAKGAIDQASSFRSIVDSSSDLLQWAGSHWYIGAAAAGFAAWYFGAKIVSRRVQDHRSGANMSR